MPSIFSLKTIMTCKSNGFEMNYLETFAEEITQPVFSFTIKTLINY